MRLTDNVAKCAVFLGFGDPSDKGAFTPLGTGFLVSCQGPESTYIVTAAHLVRGRLDDGPLDVRLNDTRGTAKSRRIVHTGHIAMMDTVGHDVVVPAGMGLTVPPTKILEVLNRAELAAARKAEGVELAASIVERSSTKPRP